MHTLIVLIGPTGVGKTELSLLLAKLLSSPVISADSRQIYRDIPIGTAAPTPEELKAVRHYFIGTMNLDQYYSAAQYEADVMKLTDELFKTHDTLLLTGGSMLYVDAVTKGIDDIPSVDDEVRLMLKERLDKEGLDALKAELRLIDPEYYSTVDLMNHKRIVHALEIYYTSGRPFSSFRTNTKKERPFRILKFGLKRERQVLFDRINRRVDQMMADGLLDEVRRVYPLRHLNSLNTVGYKELFHYLDEEWPLDMAVERIKKNTRVYAKKQMTWFAHDPEILWLDADNLSTTQMAATIISHI
ncbi:MAG: tRNA (adenosine(37)-N6)-dimethylallyltransferase MiaA [Bacteroidaceae bacterium]|nr:tRNA (adenosine(37)-N6)-dimethylallyltransferase MiaA [Bacteroidaceae bacterium]